MIYLISNGSIVKIIEVKGWIKKKDLRKIKLFRQEYDIPLDLWGREDLKKLDLLDGNGYGKYN